jgi:hypothetical protein
MATPASQNERPERARNSARGPGRSAANREGRTTGNRRRRRRGSGDARHGRGWVRAHCVHIADSERSRRQALGSPADWTPSATRRPGAPPSWAGAGNSVLVRDARGATIGPVPFATYPLPPHDPALDLVANLLDPVLTPLGFAPGSTGASDGNGQVIFCRGYADSADGGCVDLVVDLAATPDWRITDVRYWGFPTERWHVPFLRDGDLAAQLAQLARTLPDALA